MNWGGSKRTSPPIDPPRLLDKARSQSLELGNFDRTELDAQRLDWRLHHSKKSPVDRIALGDKHAYGCHLRLDLLQQGDAFHHQFGEEVRESGDIAAGMTEAVGKSKRNEIAIYRGYDRNALCHPVRRIDAAPHADDEVNLEVDEFPHQLRQMGFVSVSVSILDFD